MVKSSEKKFVAISLLALALVFSIVAALTDCSAGGADNYAHFNIARWAFRYPHLFLDHWGKPVFTLLIAPFTQLGFFGARLFNILGGFTTAWICYLLASKWKIPKAWLVPVFVVFAPMYFVLMFSGMTEILSSLILILAIWLFFSERMILSAIVISFIILVRTEGFVFLPVFLTAFALKRKYSAIPYLFFGFLLYSWIGQLFYYYDFWWFIHQSPYVGGTKDIYGSGAWYYFLERMPDYLGYGIIFFFLIGIFFWIKDWISIRLKINSEIFYQLFILGGCFVAFLAIHSYAWWRGEVSLGLTRVMVGVSPIAGIVALVGFSHIDKLIPSKKFKLVFLILSVALIGIPGVLKYKSEFGTDPHSLVIKKAVSWLHETNNFKHHLIVHDPSVVFIAKVDAWDQKVVQYGFSDANAPEKEIPDSSIFIWDAHYSQNEGRLSASKILENPYFELIAYFEPDIPFQVLNGYDYNVMIFRKVKERTKDNIQILNVLKERKAEEKLLFSEFFDFETSIPEKVAEKFRFVSNDSISNHYYQLGTDSEFSPSVLVTDQQVKISNQLNFEVNFDFFQEEAILKNEVVMVFSVEENDKPYYYQTNDILTPSLIVDKWNHCNFRYTLPEELRPNTKIKLYIWDIKKKKLRIDNFKIQVF